MTTRELLATLKRMGAEALPENKGYSNRVQVPSRSDPDRVYVIAQSKATGHWSCSCPPFIFQKGPHDQRKPCRHLQALGLIGEPAPKPRRVRRPRRPAGIPVEIASNWLCCRQDRTG